MKNSLLVLVAALCAQPVFAQPAAVKVLGNKNQVSVVSDRAVNDMVRSLFPVDQYREVRAQVIYDAVNRPNHVLVYLFDNKFHKVEMARVDVNARLQPVATAKNYQLNEEDFAQQPGTDLTHAACPDPSVEFIAFCPNDVDVEQQVTVQTADAAEKAGYKVVRLLKKDATRENYLNYMMCPKLKGNFYDGDSNPDLFITVDGTISAQDMGTILKSQFRYKVTNIWLACQAYNDPMLSNVQDGAQAQKFAAGVNDLLVGPSDKAAACAMQAAVQGKPMKAAFDDCVKRIDTPEDHWGYGGKGSDNFGQ